MVSLKVQSTILSLFMFVSLVCSTLNIPLLKRQETPTEPPSELYAFPENVFTLTAWEALVQNPSFSEFTTLVRAHSPSIVSILNTNSNSTDEKLTVFAPYNPAIQNLTTQEPIFDFANSTSDFDNLWTQAFAYHIVQRPVFSSDIPQPPEKLNVTTLNGLDVTAQRASQRPSLFLSNLGNVAYQQETGETLGVYINDASVIQSDVQSSNGVIHVVDRLVTPLFMIPPFPTTYFPFPTAIPTTLPDSPVS